MTEKQVPLTLPAPRELTEALGVDSISLQLRLLDQSLVLFRDGEDLQKAVETALAVLKGIAPRDTIEGMLAVQMTATHDAATKLLKQALLPGQTFAGKDMNLKHAEKLLQIYARQLEALAKYRNKGQQKITVERVNVEPGGQAIVGHVDTGVGGKASESAPSVEVKDPPYSSARKAARRKSSKGKSKPQDE